MTTAPSQPLVDAPVTGPGTSEKCNEIIENSLDGISQLLALAAPLDQIATVSPSSDTGPGPWSVVTDDANELPNMALAPEEVATLQSLVSRYDQVISELDRLNHQIESLLQSEGIKACES